ncbi:MAG: TolC family protein [Deferribacteres bacterium]|nr:TolC family protein [Deferribacteres bacterium]
MTKLISILILVTSMLFNTQLRGQTDSLSFAECLHLALQNSPGLKSHDASFEAAITAEKAARAGYFPHIFAEASHNQLFYSPFDYRQQSGTVLLDWSLGDWMQKTATVSAKEAEVRTAEKQTGVLDLVRTVTSLYFGLLRSQKETGLLDKRLQILREHHDVVRALWQSGVRTELDVLLTNTEINNVQEQRNTQQSETDKLRQALSSLLNISENKTRNVQSFPVGIIAVRPDTTANLLAQHPKLRSLQLQAEAQKLHLNQVAATRWPHVQVHGGYVVDRDPTAEGNYWQAGIGLHVPLFRWKETSYRKQEINQLVNVLEWQKKQTELELTIQQKQLLRELAVLRSNYKLQLENVQITGKAIHIATANYQAGLVTNLEYLEAQKENMTAQVRLYETRLLYATSLIEYFILTNEMEKIESLQGKNE